jgi:hypothetical protein
MAETSTKAMWLHEGSNQRRLMVGGRNLGHIQGQPTAHSGTKWYGWANGESLGEHIREHEAMCAVERILISHGHLQRRDAVALNIETPAEPNPNAHPANLAAVEVKPLSQRLKEREESDAVAKDIAARAGVSLATLAEGLGPKATDAEIAQVAQAVVMQADVINQLDRTITKNMAVVGLGDLKGRQAEVVIIDDPFEPILTNAERDTDPIDSALAAPQSVEELDRNMGIQPRSVVGDTLKKMGYPEGVANEMTKEQERRRQSDKVRDFSLVAMIRKQKEWSEKTFGPGTRLQGVLNHIRKELTEIEDSHGLDTYEWIDILILVIDGAMRAGHSPEDFVTALMQKVEINHQREWPDWRQFDQNTPIEHDRSKDKANVDPLPGGVPIISPEAAEQWAKRVEDAGLWPKDKAVTNTYAVGRHIGDGKHETIVSVDPGALEGDKAMGVVAAKQADGTLAILGMGEAKVPPDVPHGTAMIGGRLYALAEDGSVGARLSP